MEVLTAGALPPPPTGSLDGASLFLDFDGTLVDLAERPDAVSVDARLHALVGRLALRLDGRLAIISGRSVADVRALFGQPNFTVAGSHGVEFHYADGRTVTAAVPDMLAPTLAAMQAFAAQWPGVLIEDKPLSAALHFRQAPEAARAATALAEALAAEHALRIVPGKMMIELCGDAGNKGSALRTLMGDKPMRGTRPIMIGDDFTDEAALQAAADLRGFGILVGPERATAARYRLPDVAAVHAWLGAASEETP